jgi:hypothetical protein
MTLPFIGNLMQALHHNALSLLTQGCSYSREANRSARLSPQDLEGFR